MKEVDRRKRRRSFSSPFIILDDYMMSRVILSGFTGKEMEENWPPNFVVRGTPKKTLKSFERVAKICVKSSTGQSKWYYMIVCEAHELHEEEGLKAGLTRLLWYIVNSLNNSTIMF